MWPGAAFRRKVFWNLAASVTGAAIHRKNLQYTLQVGPFKGLIRLQGSVHFSEHLLWGLVWDKSPVHAKIESWYTVQIIRIFQVLFANCVYPIRAALNQSFWNPDEVRLMCVIEAQRITTNRFNFDHLLFLGRRTLGKTFFWNRALTLFILNLNSLHISSLQAMKFRSLRLNILQSSSGLGADLLWFQGK